MAMGIWAICGSAYAGKGRHGVAIPGKGVVVNLRHHPRLVAGDIVGPCVCAPTLLTSQPLFTACARRVTAPRGTHLPRRMSGARCQTPTRAGQTHRTRRGCRSSDCRQLAIGTVYFRKVMHAHGDSRPSYLIAYHQAELVRALAAICAASRCPEHTPIRGVRLEPPVRCQPHARNDAPRDDSSLPAHTNGHILFCGLASDVQDASQRHTSRQHREGRPAATRSAQCPSQGQPWPCIRRH
jgi:hypothetical protein